MTAKPSRVREIPAGKYDGLVAKFRQHVYALPGGEAIDQCIQCGTCSGSCPTSWAMDYSPREIISAFRAGNLEIILEGNTMWMCTSCYLCTERCPQDIRVTDLMYELKRLAVRYGTYPKGLKQVAVARTFTEQIELHGRNSEPTFMLMYYLRTNPFKLVTKGSALGIAYLAHGRLKPMEAFFPKNIKGAADIRKIFAALKDAEVGDDKAVLAKSKEAHA